jgi:hypothetical protein
MLKESVYDRMTIAEKEVAKVLKKFRIQWTFEQPLFVWDDDGGPRVWTPDFYLVQFGILLEVCGSEKFDYEYRCQIFDRNVHRAIFYMFTKKQKNGKNTCLVIFDFLTHHRNRGV